MNENQMCSGTNYISKSREWLYNEEVLIAIIDDMIKKEELLQEKRIKKIDTEGNVVEAIYLPSFYFAEIGVARKLKKLAAESATDRLWTGLMKAREERLME